MAINQELLEILACPKCKGDIYLNDAEDGLICDNCKLLYEIRDDIPIMLIDEARSLGDYPGHYEQTSKTQACQTGYRPFP